MYIEVEYKKGKLMNDLTNYFNYKGKYYDSKCDYSSLTDIK